MDIYVHSGGNGVSIFCQKEKLFDQFENLNSVTKFPCLLELNMSCVTRYDGICSTNI